MRLAVIQAAGAAALLLAAPALSQGMAPPKWNPRAPENSQLLPSFSYASVEPVLTAIGTRHQRTGQPARPSLAVTFPNNRRAVLTFGSCNAAGACKALAIQSIWPKAADAAPEWTAQAVAGFNQRYSFAKAFLLADGRPALQRYLTADYGFIRGNLAVNLLVFANQAERFSAEALRPLEVKK
jgi:hypothetical protein